MSDNIIKLVSSIVGAINLPRKDIQDEILEQKISLQLYGLRLKGENDYLDFAPYPDSSREFYPCKIQETKYIESWFEISEHFSLVEDPNRNKMQLYPYPTRKLMEIQNYHYGEFRFTKDTNTNKLRISLYHSSGDINRTDDKIPNYDISNGVHTPSLWKIMQPSARYKTLTEAAYFFKDDAKAYASFHLPMLNNTKFDDGPDSITFSQDELTQLRTTYQTYEIDAHFEDTTGFCVEKVAKYVDIANGRQTQFLRPFTRYRYYNNFYTIPVGLPGKQFLLNLPAIMEADTVVFCTNLCDAWDLQNANTNKSEAFTSALFDCGCYEQVDWTPLRDKKVIILISNHSGLTLAESYLEADRCYQYLRDCEMISDIHFIQRAVEYPDTANCTTAAELADFLNHHPGKVIEGSIIKMNEVEFTDNLERAKVEIARKAEQSKDFSFWKSDPIPTQEVMDTPQREKSLTDRMIMRPYFYRGMTTVVVAKPGVGKTCFLLACGGKLAGSGKDFLSGRYWTPCKRADGQRNYRVAFFNFDSDGGSLPENKKKFVGKLQDESHFILKDFSDGKYDFSDMEHYPLLKNEIEKLGTIDLLIIDTLLALTRKTPQNAFEIMKQLNSDFPDMCLVISHHLNDEGKLMYKTIVGMGPRAIISLSRDTEKTGQTLKTPITVSIGKSNLNRIPADGENFFIRLNNKDEFVVCQNSSENSLEIAVEERDKFLGDIVHGYKKEHGLKQQEIARLFGINERQLRNWLKPEEEK